MNDFCVEAVSVPAKLRPAEGVLRMAALAATADAGQLVRDMLAQARQEAQQVRAAAQAEARQAVQQAQRETATQGSLLLETLGRARDDMLERVEALVAELAQEVLDRLLLELTPRERIAAMVRRIRLEAPAKLREAVLWVHPDDRDHLPDSAWEVQADTALTPGSCRLEAASGEWRADFPLAAQALREGLAQAAELLRAPPEA